jgi:hypothetical protein
MPVVPVLRRVLRGRIRAQTRYAYQIGQSLLRAFEKNPELLLFNGATGPGSTGDFQIILNQWATALNSRS